jgi:acetyl esterase/lipase
MALMITGVACKKSGSNADLSNLPAEQIPDVSYGADAQQKMDVYLPAGRNTADTKALILLHGGAWMSGDKSEMTSAITALKTMLPDYAFFNVNYRLAHSGGNLWPTQMNDVNAAVDFIRSQADQYKFNNSKIAIGGASAGAHLALLKAYTSNNGSIKAAVDLFGPTDMKDLYNSSTSSTQFVLSFFMSGTPTSNAAAYMNASPLFAVNANSVPTIILHGTADNIVPIHQSDSLNNRLANAGVIKEYHIYPGEIHGVWNGTNTADAYAKITAFLKLHVK